MGSGSQLTITEDDAYALAARDPGDPGRRADAARQRAGRVRQQQLGDADLRHHARLPGSAAVGSRLGPARCDQSQVDSAAKVVLLGQTVARALFGDADPVGETVRIRRVPHTVIGLLDRKGQSMIGPGPGRRRPDPDLDGAQARARAARNVKTRNVQNITVRVRDGADIAATEQEMRDLLRQRHKLQSEPGGRFLHPQPVGGAGGAGGIVEDPRAPARGDRLGVARRRRHRHHEHHAGLGDRAHARDRPAAWPWGRAAATS